MFFDLPSELISIVLFEWLRIFELTFFDAAVCNQVLRKNVLENVFSFKNYPGISYAVERDITWVVVRKAKIAELIINERFGPKKKILMEQINCDYIQTIIIKPFFEDLLRKEFMANLINRCKLLTHLKFYGGMNDQGDHLIFDLDPVILGRLIELSIWHTASRQFSYKSIEYLATHAKSLKIFVLKTAKFFEDQTSLEIAFKSLISNNETCLQILDIDIKFYKNPHDNDCWADEVCVVALNRCVQLTELHMKSDSPVFNSDIVLHALLYPTNHRKSKLHKLIISAQGRSKQYFRSLRIHDCSRIAPCYSLWDDYERLAKGGFVHISVYGVGGMDDNNCYKSVSMLSEYIRHLPAKVQLTLRGQARVLPITFPMKSFGRLLAVCSNVYQLDIDIKHVSADDIWNLLSGVNHLTVLYINCCDNIDTKTVLKLLAHNKSITDCPIEDMPLVNMPEVICFVQGSGRFVLLYDDDDCAN